MKTAVTGAAGFVGSHLVELLLKKGHDVVALDRVASGDSPDDVEWRIGDIRDSGYVSDALGGIESVFHLAAVVGVSNYLANPVDVIDVNVIGTRNVLLTSAERGTRVVLASTSEVFGKNPAIPWSEEDDRVLGPTTIDRWSYSTSKAVGEHLAFALHRQRQLGVSVVRFFNAYGPRQLPNYVISRAIHRVLNGLPPIVYDGGSQTRCFTYIEDIVAGTVASTSDGAVGQAINLGSSVETTVLEATRVVLEEAGSDLNWEDLNTSSRFGHVYQDIDRRVPDVTKAKGLLGWSASTSLRDGVRRTIRWARSQPDWLAAPDPMSASAPTTTERGMSRG